MAVTHPLIETDGENIIKIGGKNAGGVTQLSKFFGRQPGQSLKDFGQEIKDLTLDDKVQLVGGIADGTLNY